MRERCCEDDTFSHLFMAHFTPFEENKTKADYQGQIRSTVASVADDDGFIGWGEMQNFEQINLNCSSPDNLLYLLMKGQ